MKLLALLVIGATTCVCAERGIEQFTPVRTTESYEFHPAGGSGWLAWARLRRSDHRSDTYIARGRGRPVRVNPPRTAAVPGGIDGSVLAYAQRSRTGRSSLRLFDLRTGRRQVVRVASNTRCSPNCTIFDPPSISGDWLLYSSRGALGYRAVVELQSLSTGRVIQLDEGTSLKAGQVAGRYAVWTNCDHATCRVRLYDISTGSGSVLPVDGQASGASVTPTGTVYLMVGQTCGGRLTKVPLGRVPEDLGRGSGGIGTYAMQLRRRTIVYLDQESCGGDDSDIYAFVDRAR